MAPNILLLMTDQQRWDSLGCYGFGPAHTPNLDQLATGGARFDLCYVNNPVCTPSRASLFTGKHITEHGVHRLYDVLPDDEVLFPRYLQDQGYATALFGKLHVSSRVEEHRQRHPHDGFETYEYCMDPSLDMTSPLQAYARWLEGKFPSFYRRLLREGKRVLHHPQEMHMTHWACDRGIRFIETYEGQQPFFLCISLFDPHCPYHAHPFDMIERIDVENIPAPLVPCGGPKELLRARQQGDMDDEWFDAIHRDRIGYHATIAFLDQEFGRVLDALE